MVCRWTAKSPTGPPPGPCPSKGFRKSMLMRFVSTGAVPRAKVTGLGMSKNTASLPNFACCTHGH
eukprot:1160821-Pelagomonas_calceolata.AAC.6